VSHLLNWFTSCIYFFQGRYRNWAKRNKYESKLPGDVKKRKAAKAAAEVATRTLDRDLTEKKIAERVVPYSDQAFRRAIIEWLVSTDQVLARFLSKVILSSNLVLSIQPLQALEHPKFKDMIDLAARATNGVKISGRKATQAEIKRMFKEHLTRLKAKLNVRTSLEKSCLVS
jgi:trans-aconitate methyltransferase